MRKFYLFALVAALFAACTTDTTKDIAVEIPETLTVSFEGDTRIQLMNGKTVWNTGDLVSVFYKSDANDCYKFTGTTGDRTSELVRTAKGEKSRSGDHIITVYPYSKDYIISLSDGTIEAHLPAEQTYVNESFGIGSSPMVSMSEYKQVVLKNVCGWLKVQFTGNGEVVNKITLSGNNGEQVAGDIMIVAEDASTILASAGMDLDDTEVGGTLVGEDSIITEVSLVCPDGVTLGSEPTSFYIALPPQTFSKGLTVTLYSDKSGAMKQTTDKSITISRNIVQPLASVEANLQPNKIYYTSTDGKIVTPYRTTAFGGANIVSNTYEDGQGIITFDAPVTTIGNYAFEDCSRLTSITIPDSVTTLSDNPFEGCSKLTEFNGKFASADKRCLIVDGVLNSFAPAELTEYTIPDSVTKIGSEAFYRCSSLKSVTIPDSVTSIGYYAFRGCSSLKSVYLASTTPPTLGANAFQYYENGEYKNLECTIYVPSVALDKYKNAENWSGYNIAANSNELLYTSTDGKIVTPYSTTAFGGANIISNTYENGQGIITFDAPVTEIGYRAFYYCSSLTSVTIPDSVTQIGSYAFQKCSSLKDVYCNAAYPPTLGSDVFSNTALENIYVYAESVDIYKAKWSSYADKVITNGKNNSNTTTFTYTTTDGNPMNVSNVKFLVKSNTYTDSIGTLVVYGKSIHILKSAFYGCNTLQTIHIPQGVTSIEEKAFYNCRRLTSVTIPDSVTSIGEKAFYNCGKLTSITIPDSVTSIGDYAFYDCSSLENITIGNSVTSIGDNAFSGCSSLTSVTIPDSVTSIREYTFCDCSSLASITIPNSVTSIGSLAFDSCSSLASITIPDSVTSIGDNAFRNCRKLTSVTIPYSVTSLGNSAFCGCSNLSRFYGKYASSDMRCLLINRVLNSFAPAGLTEYTIPRYSVTSIGDYAFYFCGSLTNITIPDSVTSIGDYAFEGCSSLTSVTIPDSVTSIGEMAFYNCSNLASVYISDITAWCNIEFSYWAANPLCNKAKLYLNYTEVTELTIPDSVTSIGDYAFYGCSSLASITIPDSVTSIESRAFYNCSSLTEVTIPDSVTSIGKSAFSGCNSLIKVYSKPTTPPYGGSDMFLNNATGRRIYVPRASESAYEAAEYWSDYAADIEPYDF